MSFISVFEVLGPNMIGPSSSHTAGAAAIAFLAQKMLAETVEEVDFILYGSFAKTYHGHGTDRALLGGIMGFNTEDERIRDSFELADAKGLTYSFSVDEEEKEVHPNTVDIRMTGTSGRKMTVRGESIGGGKVQITRMNSVKIHFTGEYSAVIVTHQDRPGVASHITKCLSDREVNIAYMRLFREDKGKTAYTIVESDGALPSEVAAEIQKNPYVSEVVVVEP
ncbi:MAG: L-serine ammonia-lyase, iron-sulfur-dependent subunit beta [Lachnospiraceae bacterium]|nr:L-serine ammonia-lyase, iron-sulfur-dependent subunit beta [Lachnospiraceae bacterium]